MNFKKFSTSDNQWHDIPYYQHKTATDTLTLPAVIYPNDTSITVGIKGQSSQNGTPTPQNPVDVVGTGERTGNLFNPNSTRYYMGKGINNKIGHVANGAMFYIKAASNTNYTIKIHTTDSTFVRLYLSNAPIVENVAESYAVISESETMINPEVTISNTDYAYLWIQAGGTWYTEHGGSSIMLNVGSTALPYEPHGFKIPILMGGTTNNVYLGEVQTTRKIKKLVLDGTESWTITSGKFYYITLPTYPINWLAAITSHFEVREDISATGCARFGGTATTPQNTFIFNYDNGAGGITAWKSYLAQQYANGTPVTIWYVLATPETAVVNEPLMKIGSYSDSLTTSIPVTAGENSLDVQTTVAPSEVAAGFSGWHAVSAAHERENGQWD